MTTSVAGYKIGKVAQLTGISTDKLRTWERRYTVVNPIRSDAGDRLYGNIDINRLKIIKTLIESGDSISNVASLSLEELQARIAKESESTNKVLHQGAIRIVIIGGSLASKFAKLNDSNQEIDFVATYIDVNSLTSNTEIPKVDILVFEKSALQEKNIQQLLDLTDRFNANHTIVVYRFASQDTLKRLPRSKFKTLRAPIDANAITDHCRSLFISNKLAVSNQHENLVNDKAVAPARRYDDGTLEKISELSPVVKCECPHHLAELIFALTSFEKYSRECESLNLQDAELHAYLEDATAKARHIIENALEKVIEIENIQV